MNERDRNCYKPAPLETSHVELPEGLLELIELLAENTHDNWAKLRMDEGWSYGPERNDHRKEHPSLVPYSELSESEKEYDRRVAVETLRAIIIFKYEIMRSGD